MEKSILIRIVIIFLAFCIGILLYISLSLSPVIFCSPSACEPVQYKVIAHRGGGGTDYPESSLSAIQNAIAEGVDGIEIDIHQTKDNFLVVMHDKSIDRTTNGKGLIKDFYYKDLQQYSLNNSKNNESIPLLEDVLKIVDGKCKLIIELKLGDFVLS